MSKLSEQIISLRNQNKTYDEIKLILNCSKGTISFHIGNNQKQKSKLRQIKNRQKQHPYIRKIENFNFYTISNKNKTPIHKYKKLLKCKTETFARKHGDNMYQTPTFTPEDVINKFGLKPKCYLTGNEIDIMQPRTYEFDHIIPRSKGGSNSLDNLGICTKQANQSKRDMTPDELINLCKTILEHQGYKITKL